MRKLFCLLSFALMISCSTIKFIGNPTTTKLIDYNKKEPLAEYEKKFWHLMDPLRDSVAGMSVDRAYEELIKNQKGEKIIVIDDLIATGGTAEGAAKLIEVSGGEVAAFIFVINLFDLPGEKLLSSKGYYTKSLIEFPGH